MIKLLYSIFDIKTKIKALSLFILNIISAFLDIISIGSIPIFLYYSLEPDKLISKIPFEKAQSLIGEILKNNNNTENLYLILFIIIFIFVSKNIFIFLVNLYQIYFSRKVKTEFTAKLFNIYMARDYDFYLESSSANFLKNLESVHILPSIIMISLGIIKEVSIILGLLLIIGYTNSSLAIFLTFIFILFYCIHKFKIGKILTKQGKKSYDYAQERYALINEIFGSVADIKLLNKEKFFFIFFKGFIWKFETAIIITKIINSLIRPLTETIGILVMVTLIVYFTSQGKSFSEIIPILSFLALSFIRVIPSATLLTSYIGKFKFEEKQLNYLIQTYKNDDELHKKMKSTSAKKYLFNESLELKNIDFAFKGIKKRSISNINLKINKNDKFAIIGKTDSGNSTVINWICNPLKFSKGQIILDNNIIINPNENFLIENLHYVRQDILLLNGSVKKNIAFGIDDHDIDEELVVKCLKKVGLNQYTDRLDEQVGSRGTKVSGGEKQLLGLARALYTKPQILILDEPTSNLDYKNEKAYFDVIKELQITTIIVAHRTNTLEHCDKIILLKDGSIIDQGSLEKFKKKYDNLSNYIN